MEIKNGKMRILLALVLLIVVALLFVFSVAEKNVGTIFFRGTLTPEPIYDVFLIRCEVVLETLKGDTLDAIASNFSVSKENIITYNRLKSDDVSPGMMLLIPVCSNMPTPTVTPIK